MKSSSPSIVERVVRTLFGLAFCVIPMIILSVLARSSLRERDVRLNWVPTPCVVVDSEIRDAPNGSYALAVRYRYETGGRTFESTGYSPGNDHHTFDSVSERAPLLATYEKGASTTCFVNPADPAQAVLHPRDGDASPWGPAVLILFLIPFILVGLAVAASAWWHPRRRRDAKGTSPVPGVSGGTPPSESRSSALAVVVPIVFCSVFIAAGGVLMSFGLRQRAQAKAAGDWPVAEGVVERIEVKRKWQNGSRGRPGRWLYSPYVVYAYEVNGSRRENDRLAFSKTSSSKQGPAVRYVEEHPVGSRVGVRYNLADPSDSVLDAPDAPKSGSMENWLPIGAGAVFALFGAGFLFVMLTSPRDDAVPDATPSATGVLKRKSRKAELVQTLVFTTLWCSLCALLDAAFLSGIDWPPRGEDWIPLVILGVFTCIGAGLVVRSVALVFRPAGPHLEITCGRGFLARGMETIFSYRLVGGRVEDVESVVVWLVGQRRTPVRRRNETRIEKREFSRTEVLRATAATPHTIGQGFFRVELPADALPSGRDEGCNTREAAGDGVRFPGEMFDEMAKMMEEAESRSPSELFDKVEKLTKKLSGQKPGTGGGNFQMSWEVNENGHRHSGQVSGTDGDVSWVVNENGHRHSHRNGGAGGVVSWALVAEGRKKNGGKFRDTYPVEVR